MCDKLGLALYLGKSIYRFIVSWVFIWRSSISKENRIFRKCYRDNQKTVEREDDITAILTIDVAIKQIVFLVSYNNLANFFLQFSFTMPFNKKNIFFLHGKLYMSCYIFYRLLSKKKITSFRISFLSFFGRWGDLFINFERIFQFCNFK